MRYYIDTNYFLRFFLNDNEEQTHQVRELFIKGSLDEVELFSSIVVFLEVYWVLKSFYTFSKEKIIASLEAITQMDFIKFEKEETMLVALNFFKESSLDLEDCFHLAYLKKASHNSRSVYKLATFDKKLKNIKKTLLTLTK